MPEPYNYAGILGQAQQLVPNVLDQQIRRSIGMAQVQQVQQQAAAAQQKQQRFGQYQEAIKAYLADPTPQGASGLITQFPEYAEQVTSGWKVLDAQRQATDKRMMGQAYAALLAGRPELALGQLKARYQADEKAGEATDIDRYVVEALESGDPTKIKEATGFIGANLAAIDADGFKAQFGDKTALQRNKEYLDSIGRPELAESYLQGETNKPEIFQITDPVTKEVRTYSVPRVPAAPAAQPEGPVDGFAAFSGAQNLIRSMGATGFLSWQQRYQKPVLVTSPEEMAALPAGTLVISQDGRRGVKR